MADGKSSLSPAQIQYLKIGPKIGRSEQSKKALIDAIAEQERRGTEESLVSVNGLNKVPKLTYGEFEKTVNNFGVLLNKNFGSETTIHQIQKFGDLARNMNKIMIAQKDKPIYNQKKLALMKKVNERSDARTFIKSIYDFEGEKIYVVLKSFTIQSASAHKLMDGLPIPYMRFLIAHVNSSRLAKILEGSTKGEGNYMAVEYEKMESRASHLSNNELKYQKMAYTFERMGQELSLVLPSLEFNHVESGFQQSMLIENNEIIETLDTNFDNVSDLFEKYVDQVELRKMIKSKDHVQEAKPASEKRQEPELKQGAIEEEEDLPDMKTGQWNEEGQNLPQEDNLGKGDQDTPHGEPDQSEPREELREEPKQDEPKGEPKEEELKKQESKEEELNKQESKEEEPKEEKVKEEEPKQGQTPSEETPKGD